jgi:hypothetical protein
LSFLHEIMSFNDRFYPRLRRIARKFQVSVLTYFIVRSLSTHVHTTEKYLWHQAHEATKQPSNPPPTTTKMILHLLASLQLFGLLTTTTVSACGGLVCQPRQPVLQAGENIAFGVSESTHNGKSGIDITMAVQINYRGPAESFGWILPVPVQPQVSVGSDILFEALFEASRPTFEFTIDTSRSTTCDDADLEEQQCVSAPNSDVAANADGGNDGGDAEKAIVLEQGTVGPFDFTTLQPADNRPESVFEWLNENGYDQPPDTAALINYYAGMGMKFVALRLQKKSEAGDIRPIILQYSIDGANLETNPVACIPIQLTRVAATPAMPIQVYVLAPYRGFPINYFHMTLDDRFVDWVGCYNNNNDTASASAQQDCYLIDMRNRFRAVANSDLVDGHAFLTEYAGSAEIVKEKIDLGIDLENLYEQDTAKGFLLKLATFDVPDITFVHTIIERHIPNRFRDTYLTPPICFGLTNVYTPDTLWMMDSCLDLVDFGDTPFNPRSLADALEEDVFEPAREAQVWVNSYDYLTRLYGQLDPEQMDKDPFFAFNSTLVDVSRDHEAVGVPVCSAIVQGNSKEVTGLDIYVWDQGNNTEKDPFPIDALFTCGAWFGGRFFPPGPVNPALELVAFGFVGTDSRVLFPDEVTGEFLRGDLQELIDLMDGRVPNQTVPHFDDPNSSCRNPLGGVFAAVAPFFTVVLATCGLLA